MSVRPDLIISWPKSADYPLWRKQIRKNRERFNNVIIVFTETNHGHDYSKFVKDAMFKDFVLCTYAPITNSGEDWRNNAIHFAFIHSLHTEWLFFTEQDFFFHEGFWDFVNANEDKDYIGVMDATRLHPCCLFVKRTVLNQTRKNFGIVAGRLDHFGLIQQDLENGNFKGAIIPENLYTHMAGLSHNLTLIFNGNTPNYHVEELDRYLKASLKVDVPLSKEYTNMITGYFDEQ